MEGGQSLNYWCLCGEPRDECGAQCAPARAFQSEIREGRANLPDLQTRLEFCKGTDFSDDGTEFYNMWIEMRPMQVVLCQFDRRQIQERPQDVEELGLMVCLIFNHYCKTAADEKKKIAEAVALVERIAT